MTDPKHLGELPETRISDAKAAKILETPDRMNKVHVRRLQAIVDRFEGAAPAAGETPPDQ